MTISRTALAILAGFCLASPLQAQEAQPHGRAPQAHAQSQSQSQSSVRLPPESVTRHTVELPGRMLAFVATAGAIRLNNPAGEAQVEIAYVSYALEGAQPANRPVLFALNGGPGSASAWLHLGGLGPWRVSMTGEAVSPSAPPVLLPNAETWLDFADLVFIDPVGTGYSRFARENDDLRKRVFSADGDIEILSSFIRRWLTEKDRLFSPKFLLGESYAGYRAPRMARRLADVEGVGLGGLILVSPVLDFRRFMSGATPFGDVARLPSMAAAAMEAKGEWSAEKLAEAEDYARADYLVDLTRGPRDRAALDRVVKNVARFSGLDETLVRRLGGRVDMASFTRELARSRGLVASSYDAGVLGPDPFPLEARSNHEDPLNDALIAPFTSAMTELLRNRLGWKPDGRYMLFAPDANSGWDWGRGGRARREAVSDLAQALALDPKLNVLVTHGAADLVTPYFETRLVLDQMPETQPPGRVTMKLYRGGHMHYSRDDMRALLREDARKLVEKR